MDKACRDYRRVCRLDMMPGRPIRSAQEISSPSMTIIKAEGIYCLLQCLMQRHPVSGSLSSSTIMRTFQFWPTLTFCIAGITALPASAQQPPSSAPPKLEKLEEGEAPEITIRKPDTERKVIEKRQQGKVTEVKVQTGGSTYYVKPNASVGSALPGDAESSSNRAPQWQVMEFGGPRPEKEAEPPQTLPPASQPPAPATK
jgi:hypothetical protein